MNQIPQLDLNDFRSSDFFKKNEFVKNIGEAYSEIGFVAIKNHCISEELINKMYSLMEQFFALPVEIKTKYEDGKGGQRGYTSFGKEHAKDRPAVDLKEFWHFGQYVNQNDDLFSFYPSNKFVDELPEFNLVGREIYQAMEICGSEILKSLALYLNLEENYFEDKIHKGNSILRPIHYPPITQEPENSIRAGEHEDINLITLLVGASAEGLEVLNRNNEWIPVTKVQDCIVVNVGDMLQRLTNNVLKSTTHRVVNPPKETWHKPRYSLPFFLHPRPEASLNCLPSCISNENPKQYEDCTANEYLTQRLREIGLLK